MHGKARAVSHPWRLVGLLTAVGVLTLGCNPLQLAGFLLSPDAMEPPERPLAVEGKDVKVVIVAAHAGSLPADPVLMSSDWELAVRLTRMLEERFKENKDRVTVISPSMVKSYKNSHPRWNEQPPQTIGKHFDADWVVNLEINSISLFDRSSANFFYHGNADISVTVTDVHKDVNEGQVWELPYQLEYPRSRPLERSEMGVMQFRSKFLDRIAKDMTQFFASHPPREKYDSE
jgi:hypothetical protein